jgi:hypothetical protein
MGFQFITVDLVVLGYSAVAHCSKPTTLVHNRSGKIPATSGDFAQYIQEFDDLAKHGLLHGWSPHNGGRKTAEHEQQSESILAGWDQKHS